MAGMFDRDKLASEMTHEARDDSRVTFEDVIYSLLGTTAEEAGRNREEWNRLVSNPSEIVNQLSNWPDPRAFTARESDTGKTDEVVGNVSNFIPGGMFNGGIAGVLVGPHGISRLGLDRKLLSSADKARALIHKYESKVTPRELNELLWNKLKPFWHGAPDRIPRMELPDYKAATAVHEAGPPAWFYKPYEAGTFPSQPIEQYTLGELWKHPELYAAYPEFENIAVRIDPNLRAGGLWHVGKYTKESPGRIELLAHPYQDSGSVLSHEITHAIQNKEGMAPGGYGQEFLSPKRQDELKNALEKIDKGIVNLYDKRDELALSMFGKPFRDLNSKETARFLKDREVQKIGNRLKELNITSKDVATRNILQKGYTENAGEAEARAVQNRLARDLKFPDIVGDMPWEDLFNPSIEDLYVNPPTRWWDY